jgi:hypothetical protein
MDVCLSVCLNWWLFSTSYSLDEYRRLAGISGFKVLANAQLQQYYSLGHVRQICRLDIAGMDLCMLRTPHLILETGWPVEIGGVPGGPASGSVSNTLVFTSNLLSSVSFGSFCG